MGKPQDEITGSGVYGYKLTQGQVNAIKNQPFAPNQYFNPVQDINGDWFIFEEEMEASVKNKGWSKSTLSEYIPPYVNPDEI